MADDAAARFVHALAAALLGDGAPDARAAEAHAALREVLRERKSLVLEVQFTGFAEKGQLVGGVDPVLLRAAGHLIMLRVTRVGFTAEAGPGDLAAFIRAATTPAAELGEGGVLAAVAAAAPHGVYVGNSAGQGYRPPPRPAAPEEAPPAAPEPAPPGEAPPPPAPGWVDEEEETELAEFEILDPVQLLATLPAEAAPPPVAASPEPPRREGEEPPSSDMYHYFRAAEASEAGPEALPRLLAEADTMARFDELADAAARSALGLLRADAYAQAVALLDALVREGERPDRTRFFRESAVQALRRAATPDVLHRLIERLPFAGADRDRILRVFAFLGGDALLMLEAYLYRSADAELRGAVFALLLSTPGMAERLGAHAAEDPSPAKARTLLELARGPGVDPELARRWAGEVAGHRDPVARVEAARSVAALGGRGAVRALVDLLADPERVVRREAVAGLGALGEAAAVPFLARVLAEGGDEELQVAAAAALGRLGSADALPPLLAVVQKRSLLSLRRATRPRLAALQAIARIEGPAAREALQTVAAGRDDLADEARRLLAG